MALSTSSKTGLITLIAMIIMSVIVIWKTDIFMTSRGYKLIASFANIEGLTLGSEVRFRGLKVGKVTDVDPGPYDIKIFAVIEADIKIPADSRLRIAYDGIVGLKYLEIKPGTSESIYHAPNMLYGERTSAIVDFVDIGAKNLVETKAILENIRKIIENPRLQAAFINAVYTFDKTALEAEKLVKELRAATEGVDNIVSDPKFQENVKNTIGETSKTLTSANNFFEGVTKIKLRASGGVDLGTRANEVRGDVDVVQNEKNYFRVSIGEGPTRQLSVLDVLLTNKLNDSFGYRLGVINKQLGGGLIFATSDKSFILTDLYDINNPKPNNPRLRLGYQYQIRDYMDMLLQADDLLNSGNSNIMLGIRVKPMNEKLY